MWCKDGSLLHLRLGRVFAKLAGFDWSQPGVELLEQHGVTDLQRLTLLDSQQVEQG